jgi:cytochrome c553
VFNRAISKPLALQWRTKGLTIHHGICTCCGQKRSLAVSKLTISLIIFACFAFGLPIWGMQNNDIAGRSIHNCSGECYQQWQQETGGMLALARAKAEADASASPAELGKQAYAGCIACHGAGGEGGIGPALVGQSASDINAKLVQYRSGETRGSQSALMWSQAATLDDAAIENLAAYIQTL